MSRVKSYQIELVETTNSAEGILYLICVTLYQNLSCF